MDNKIINYWPQYFATQRQILHSAPTLEKYQFYPWHLEYFKKEEYVEKRDTWAWTRWYKVSCAWYFHQNKLKSMQNGENCWQYCINFGLLHLISSPDIENLCFLHDFLILLKPNLLLQTFSKEIQTRWIIFSNKQIHFVDFTKLKPFK